MSSKPDRGDLGAMGGPQWTARWSQFTHREIDEYIFRSAFFPVGFEQGKALIQGLPPPPPSGWGLSRSILDGHAQDVFEFRFAIDLGELPASMSAGELVDWCEPKAIWLPDQYRAGMLAAASATNREIQAITVIQSSWASPAFSIAPKSPRKKRGRPVTAQATYAALVRSARELQSSEAGAGRYRTLLELARMLCATDGFAHMGVANAQRRLVKKLHWAEAKETAMRVHRHK